MIKGENYFSTSYSSQIKDLVRLIVKMKLYASKILNNTICALEGCEGESVIKYTSKITTVDSKLKAASIHLEDSVNTIIALRQPVAFDLRFLLSSIKIASELLYLSNWCKKTIKAMERMNVNIESNGKKDLLYMLTISASTLKDAISLLLQFDSKKRADAEILFKIEQMLKRDDLVDTIYEKILQDGLNAIRNNQSDALMIFETIGIAKNLEKTSDCIQNIIITIRYVLTGKRM